MTIFSPRLYILLVNRTLKIRRVQVVYNCKYQLGSLSRVQFDFVAVFLLWLALPLNMFTSSSFFLAAQLPLFASIGS